MRVPLSWLREWVDVPAGDSPEDVQAALVRVGLEEEDIHGGDLSGPIVVGRVLEFADEPQKNGKVIRWCQVEVGRDSAGEPDVRGIVCGALNFFVGDLVVVTLPGAVLPGPFPIAARKTYGHVSDGMIASDRELGLGDEHDGILRLSERGLTAEPGDDALALLGLNDVAVEANITPDRGYALSIRGIAREYANSTGAAFRDPADAPGLAELCPAEATGFAVSLDDAAPIRGNQGCTVFVARRVDGVDATRATPEWMSSRLRLAGIRSISLLVDITNYVMLELGQPIHAYDAATLVGTLSVRRATAGERLTTLDGTVRELHTEDLVIADESGAIGIAGVMGGARTEISEHTTSILIEAAQFDPVSVARSSRRHRVPSEASKRFVRGVDPQVAPRAAARVIQLVQELAGGQVSEVGAHIDHATRPAAIRLRHGFIDSLVGARFTDEEISHALAAIGCELAPEAEGAIQVTPPSWRPDLTDEATLTEEVARIIGYDRIPSILPVAPPGRGFTREQRSRRAAANMLAGCGSVEVQCYPFVSERAHALFSGDAVAVRLANPLDATVPLLRRSLLPGLISTAQRNLSRGLVDLSIFELGTVFLPQKPVDATADLPSGTSRPSDDQLQALHATIPAQPWHVAALMLGNSVPKQPGLDAQAFGVADAIDAARQVAHAVGASITVRQGSHPALHPGRTAEILVGGAVVGVAGELLPAIADEFDLPRRVALVELDLEVMIHSVPSEFTASPIVSYPAATQDVSLVCAVDIPAADLAQEFRAGAGDLVEDLRLTDDYRGPGIPEGHKSVTFALRFRSAAGTLTAAEATEAKLAGLDRVAQRFAVTLRE